MGIISGSLISVALLSRTQSEASKLKFSSYELYDNLKDWNQIFCTCAFRHLSHLHTAGSNQYDYVGAALLDVVMQYSLVSWETWTTGLRMILKVLVAGIWVAIFSIFYRLISNLKIIMIHRGVNLRSACKASAVETKFDNHFILEVDKAILKTAIEVMKKNGHSCYSFSTVVFKAFHVIL